MPCKCIACQTQLHIYHFLDAWPNTRILCMPIERQDLICTLIVPGEPLHIIVCLCIACGISRANRMIQRWLVIQGDEILWGSLVCLDARVCKDLSMELSRHPDLIHGIAATLALRTKPVCLKHCAAHQESLTRLQVVRWTVVGAAPFKVGDRPSPCKASCNTTVVCACLQTMHGQELLCNQCTLYNQGDHQGLHARRRVHAKQYI